MKFYQSILGLVGLSSLAATKSDSSSPSLPTDHPASIQFSAWLSAFNTGDRETLLAYHSDDVFPYSVASPDIATIERELMLFKGVGGFDVADIESIATTSPSYVVVVLREKSRERYARSTMIVDESKPNNPVTRFVINSIITPIKFIPKDDPRRPAYEKALAPLNPERRRAVVEGISDVVLDQYVYPKVAKEVVEVLNDYLESGDFDQYKDSDLFAERLTHVIHSVAQDKHMVVAFMEPPRSDGPGDHIPDKPQKHLEDLRLMNFGFGNVTIDHDTAPGRTIATFPINGFVPCSVEFASDWQEIRAAIGEILTQVADSDALLIDLRENHGGDPETVSFLLSYLIDNGPVHMLDFVDRLGNVDQSFSTLPADLLPETSRRFGGKKPLYVLTTEETISGGEEMAYSLQVFKRSIAVIGEGNKATAGGANPITRPRWVAEKDFGKGWWLVAVPNLTPVHAVTNTNWERVGVRSDVVAGKGKWVRLDAEEVGRRLAKAVLEPRTELRAK